jgi:hypothetical protein
MNFVNETFLAATVRQHQQELLKTAEEARLVRRSDVRRLEYFRRPPRSHGPDAA